MRDLARDNDSNGTSLAGTYWVYARVRFWLGVPAFLSLVVVFWLMVAEPG